MFFHIIFKFNIGLIVFYPFLNFFFALSRFIILLGLWYSFLLFQSNDLVEKNNFKMTIDQWRVLLLHNYKGQDCQFHSLSIIIDMVAILYKITGFIVIFFPISSFYFKFSVCFIFAYLFFFMYWQIIIKTHLIISFFAMI